MVKGTILPAEMKKIDTVGDERVHPSLKSNRGTMQARMVAATDHLDSDSASILPRSGGRSSGVEQQTQAPPSAAGEA